jgi:PiT family inorganic phosphate transporter
MLIFLIIAVLSYVYAFFTGVGDAANALSTAIATRSLSFNKSILLGFVMQLLGGLVGTGVAVTISSGLVMIDKISLEVVLAGVLAMLIWSVLTYILSIPVSDTHSLVGALLGASIAMGGLGVIVWDGLIKVILAMFFSPILGFIGGYFLLHLITKMTHFQPTTSMRSLFKKSIVVTAGFTSFSNGLNNSQKPVGIALMALVLYLGENSGTIPMWLIVSVAITQAFGVIWGARLIKTMGTKISQLSSEQGFSAQAAAVVVLQLASWLGIPVSTTQVITSSIVGAGVSRRIQSVRWQVVREIGASWLLTLPASFAMGWAMSTVFLWIK